MKIGRTLYGKLVWALLALFTLAGFSYVALTVFTTQLHRQEVAQTLNRSVAADIVKEQWLMRGDAINAPALKATFTRLMEVNPSLEVYLLDNEGRIITYSAPPETVKRDAVSLEPINIFLAGKKAFPIRGDDPRDLTRRKIFSAAPIYDSGEMAGFLYIVIGGQEFDSAVQLFQQSYILRLSAAITFAAVLLAAAIGAFSFNLLTRRLHKLSAHMISFRGSDFTKTHNEQTWRRGGKGDEIDELGATFEDMSTRITDQIRKLQKADADRRGMVAAISHDLRTPLAALRGYLETLEMKNGTLSEDEKKRYLSLALGSGERLSGLIGELFELATLEASDPQMNLEPFPINELAHDVARKHRLEAEKKQLTLTTDIAEAAPFVLGDIGLMERVLDNLIGNAIKFTPVGGTVSLAITSEDDAVTARISDTGAGIADKDLPHIFDRFYQAENSGNGEGGLRGAGLGLAIVQRIVELHGSAIAVEKTSAAGTTFRFQLPAAA